MATTDLIVAFSAQVAGFETSLKRVNSRLDELSSSAQKTSREVGGALSAIEGGFARLGNNLKSIAFAAVAAALTTGLIRTAVAVDDINASLTRLRVLSGNTATDIQSLFASLRGIGQTTGQSVASLTESFTRFYTATESLGASRAQVQQLVETLAQFARVSGQTPGESSAAITQLAQGLASGRLQGDELKSILENMPPLAQALSRALNVSVGELRQMGEEGKLTAEVVFPALLRAGESLSGRLEGVPLSLRQAFQVAIDGVLSAVSAADQRIGATAWLSRLLSGAGAAGAAAAVAISGGAPGLEAQRQAEGEIAGRARERLDIERQIDRIRGAAAEQGRAINREEQGRINVLQGQLNVLPRIEASADAVNRILDNAVIAQGGLYDDFLRQQEGRIQRQRTSERTLLELRRQTDDEFKIRDEARAQRERAETARIRGENDARVDAVISGINREEQARLEALRRREAGSGPRVNNADGQRQNRVSEQLRSWIRQIEGPSQEFERRVAAIQQNINGLFTNQNLGLTQSPISYVVQGVIQDTVRLGQELQRLGQEPSDAMQFLRQRFEGIREALRNLPEEVRPSAEQIEAAINQMTEGASNGLGRLVEKAERTFNDIAREGVQTFTQDLAGGIIDFATTGEQKFDELAANFLKNIAKMILQLLLFRAIAASLGWAGINVPGVTPPVTGGSSPAPPPAPDFFMDPGGGLSAGSLPTWSPYGLGSGNAPYIEGAMGGRGVGDVTVNVYNNSNSKVRTEEKTDSNGNKMIEVFIEQVVKNGMASGRYDGVMQTSFGASRIGRV